MTDVERPEIRTVAVGGRARSLGFANPGEVREALFAVIRERVVEAINRREAAGLISSRGDAASTLFLDRQRIDALLGGSRSKEAAPAESRRERSLMRRIENGGTEAPPLARGFARWGLELADVVVVGAALAAATDPALARLLSFLGGDASRPGLTLEAAASLLGPGHDNISRLERMLSPSKALAENALVAVEGGDPYLRRMLVVNERLIAIAAGASVPERMPLSLYESKTGIGDGFEGDDLVALQAIAGRRTARPVFGWVEGEVGCDLLEVLAAVLSTRGQLVLTTPLAALGESAAAAAIIREARLADAVVAITDVSQRLPKNDAIRAAQTIDVLAAAIPLVAIGPEPLNPAVEPNTGRVILHAVTSAAEQREEALAVAAREWLSRDEIAAIAADQTLSTQQATALSGALSVLPTSHPRAAVERVLRDQGSGGADPLAALLARVETLWQSGDQFLRLGIVGPSSAAVAEAIARHLGLSFVWGVSKGNARPALTGQPARLLHFNEGDPTPALTPPGLYMLVSPRAHPRLANAVDQIIELGAAKGGLLDVLADAHGVGFE